MKGDMPSYPAYKDSGVPWLGEVPAHWHVRSFGSLTTALSERNRPDLPLLSVVREKGVIPRASMSDEENHNFVPDDLRNYKVVKRGNLVINKMKAWQGSMGIASQDGIVSPAYYVLDFDMANPQYGHMLLRSKPYVAFFAQASDGVRVGQWDLSIPGMKRIPIVIPPPDEQAAIVRYLDHMDRRIRRYIRARRRLIALLGEQKQAIIHQAVTRGLDPSVPLRPSGVEWLGDVPAHWANTRLKIVAEVQTGITLGKVYPEGELEERPYLRVANVQSGYLDLTKITTIRLPRKDALSCELRQGDVLMTEGGDIDKLGRGYIWRGEIPGCLHQNHVFAVRSDAAQLLPEFLVAVMTSKHGRNYFQATAKQTTNLASTNTTTLRALPILLPPADEQRKILEWIEAGTSSIDQAIDRSNIEIDLIREYRTRLIADVVTGKVDVSAAASALPAEFDQSGDPLDEAEAEDAALDEDAPEDDGGEEE